MLTQLPSVCLLWACGTREGKPYRLPERRHLGVSLWGGSLKTPGCACGPLPQLLRKKPGIGGASPVVRCCARSGVYGERVPRPFLHIPTWVFSQLPVCRSHPTSFWISLRGYRSTCVQSVHPWEGGNAEVPYVDIL